VGALLTCLVQASAAMMAITLVMCYNGWIGLDAAVALVMGQNIGTTITANIAAMVANTNGKRAARAHLVFNVVGVVLTLIVYQPILSLIANITEGIAGSNPYTPVGAEGYAPGAIPLALSLFHTFFNVVNTFVLAWFIPLIIRIVNWLVKEKPEDEEYVYKLKYISSWMNTAEINMKAAEREITEFSKRVLRMYTFLPGLRVAKDDAEFENIVERIEKYEAITDQMEMEIAEYLTRIAEGDLSHQGSLRISAMLCVVDNLESIGDTIYQIAATRKNKRETAVHFDQHLNDNLSHMTQLVQHALDIMDENLKMDYDAIDIAPAEEAEEAINRYRDQLREEHLNALKKGTYDFAIGNAYSSLYALYEKLGDYVINISEAIVVKYK
jgi:phosphate:Na+ symporter